MTKQTNPTTRCDCCGLVIEDRQVRGWGRLPATATLMGPNGYVPDGAGDRIDVCPDCVASYVDWTRRRTKS